jgi:Protein of unknown function (DUF2281)
MTEKQLSDKLKEIPTYLFPEIIDYIDFLLKKHGSKKGSENFNFKWENGLTEISDSFTSVELQHKSMDWR